MKVEKSTIIENWMKTSLFGSILFLLTYLMNNGPDRFQLFAYFILFLLIFVSGSFFQTPGILLLRLLIKQLNKQHLNPYQFISRITIYQFFNIGTTCFLVYQMLPINNSDSFIMVGFSFFVASTFFWYRSLIKNKNSENEEIIDDSSLIED